MARIEPVVLTNMCMIYDGDKVLVQDRKDPSWTGITFPGGHVEAKESFVDATIREVYEETGLVISQLQLCGVKQFTHSKEGYRYVVFLYKTNKFSGDLSSSPEGDVFWVKRADLEKYQLMEHLLDTLEVFENDILSENYFSTICQVYSVFKTQNIFKKVIKARLLSYFCHLFSYKSVHENNTLICDFFDKVLE